MMPDWDEEITKHQMAQGREIVRLMVENKHLQAERDRYRELLEDALMETGYRRECKDVYLVGLTLMNRISQALRDESEGDNDEE